MALCAVAILRFAWGRRVRVAGLNLAGWGLGVAALMTGWAAFGAWGLSVAVLVGTGGAFVLLAHAACVSPPGKATASNRRVGMLPERGESLYLGRRLLTFAIVGILAWLAAIGCALGVRWAVLALGGAEADATVAALLVTPLAWAILAFGLLMTVERGRQILVLLAVASPVLLPVLLPGMGR